MSAMGLSEKISVNSFSHPVDIEKELPDRPFKYLTL